MDAQNIRDFISRLIPATQIGKLIWQETADEDSFRLLLDTGIILIQRSNMQKMDGTLGQPEYKLIFLNKNDSEVDSWHPDPGKDYEQLSLLYEVARDSALRPTKLLQAMEQEVIRRSG
jgi:hypothetical protein